VLLLIRSDALGGRCKSIGHRAKVIVVVKFGGFGLSSRSRLAAKGQSLSSLGRRNQPKVVFSMLKVVFSSDGITAGMGVARQLEILLSDMLRVSADLDVRTVRLVRPRQGVRTSPIICRPAAHPLVLTWSHCLFQL
jgi:hypothetical protein